MSYIIPLSLLLVGLFFKLSKTIDKLIETSNVSELFYFLFIGMTLVSI